MMTILIGQIGFRHVAILFIVDLPYLAHYVICNKQINDLI